VSYHSRCSQDRPHRPKGGFTLSDSHAETLPSLLAELARKEIKLHVAGDGQITVTARKGTLSADLKQRIVSHKAELISWLEHAQQSGHEMDGLLEIEPDLEHLFVPFPPADLQQAFLIGSRKGFEYYVRPHQYIEIDFDNLDPAGFEEAFNKILRRHRKSLVIARDDMQLQTVQDPAPIRVTVSDFRHLPEDEAARSMADVRRAIERQEPALDRWPWLAPHISLYGSDRARLHYNNNSLFTDAPSGVGLVNEALHYYKHPEQAPVELELSFRDCALALAKLEESPLGLASKKYWSDRMPDWPSAPDLPLAPGKEHRGRSWLSRRDLVIPPETHATLKRKADEHGISLTNVLLGAHAEVISYWSGSRHFLLNSMITHRQHPIHPKIGEVLGNLASLYPLEVDWRHDEPFTERVRRLQGQVMRDVAHTYWSGAKVLQALNQLRGTPGRAICPYAVGSALFVGGSGRPHYSLLETPQTLLDTEFWQLHDDSLWVTWDVIEAMFPEGLITAMFSGYGALLDMLANDEAAWKLPAFDLLPPAQRRQRSTFNAQPGTVKPGLLHDSLPRQAVEQPGKNALIIGEDPVTYAELVSRVGQLARLLHAHAVQRGDLVAVILPKTAEQIIAVLSVLTVGAGYVPVDVGWPTDRIQYLLEDAKCRCILTMGELRDQLMELADRPVIVVDNPDEADMPRLTSSLKAAALTCQPDMRAPDAGPDDVAYVIYTSGSTGKPKGAVLNHRGPLNTILDVNRRFGVSSGDIVFGVSSLCFDLSVYDIFGALQAGATLVLPKAGSNAASWVDTARARKVSVWNSVPALMHLFVDEAEAANVVLPTLRIVLLSGDWIPVDLPARIRKVAPNAQVIGLGGATEASIWSIFFPIEDVDPAWPSIPYGKPLENQAWHVLDDLGRDAPVWVPGHLYIGGSGVALRYLNDPEKTESAFVVHPRAGDRLYRTGDLGRYLPSGDIEFLGRSDFQVKIQGFRVEPGEVEHALLEFPGISQAAVIARSSGAGKQLAAFVVGTDAENPPDPEAVSAFLANSLPSYLIPSRITTVPCLPLTANGKLDRRSLEATNSTDQDRKRTYEAPRSDIEATLAEIWESVLSIQPIGIHDDFFELGGQSFAALRMINQLAQRLTHNISLSELLECRTIAQLAQRLQSGHRVWSPLVRLTGGNDASVTPERHLQAVGNPWFLVHPAGGNVLCYKELARALRRPCYAFQAPGPASGQEPVDRVEDLADLYLRELRRVQPHGPYALGGWSSGAVIAAEMTHQLECAGETVGRLLVLDAPAPTRPRAVDRGQLSLWFLEDLNIGFDPELVSPELARELAALPPPLQLAALLTAVREQGLGDIGLSHDDLALALPVFDGIVRACNSYRAPNFAAPITVVRAAAGKITEFDDHPHAAAADWGWSSLTSGSTYAMTVPGTHYTLLTSAITITAIADTANAIDEPPHNENARPSGRELTGRTRWRRN
jgi:amino acid adenylation domain-containing protein